MKKLNKPISKSDKRGFIYGFRKKTDINTKNNFWIKLGRTDRNNPTVRVIEEWNGLLIFCTETPFNHKLESLVHYLFNYANEIRVENGKNEVEWFHFNDDINIEMIVTRLNKLMCNFWYDENKFNICSVDYSKSKQEDHKTIKYEKTFCKHDYNCLFWSLLCYCNLTCCYCTTKNHKIGCCNCCIPFC